jgi:phytoene dehydrogenase-like protein
MASGMLTVIPWLEQGIGVFIPEKGMFHITESLYRLALDLGVTFHFNTPVDKIVADGNKIKGIEISGSFIPSDVVISNMDIWFTYEKLLKGLPKPERILKQEKSTSAIVQYIGIPRTFNQLGLHNVFFSDNYEREFNCLKNGSVDKDPTIYINITSKEVEGDAPAGCENWFVMINVPHNKRQDWDTIISNSRENIRSKLIRNLNYDINDSPQTVTVMEPRTIEQKFLSHKGAIYGNASNDMFAAFLRHPNFSRRYKNLYFCGGSAHPEAAYRFAFYRHEL